MEENNESITFSLASTADDPQQAQEEIVLLENWLLDQVQAIGEKKWFDCRLVYHDRVDDGSLGSGVELIVSLLPTLLDTILKFIRRCFEARREHTILDLKITEHKGKRVIRLAYDTSKVESEKNLAAEITKALEMKK